MRSSPFSLWSEGKTTNIYFSQCPWWATLWHICSLLQTDFMLKCWLHIILQSDFNYISLTSCKKENPNKLYFCDIFRYPGSAIYAGCIACLTLINSTQVFIYKISPRNWLSPLWLKPLKKCFWKSRDPPNLPYNAQVKQNCWKQVKLSMKDEGHVSGFHPLIK